MACCARNRYPSSAQQRLLLPVDGVQGRLVNPDIKPRFARPYRPQPNGKANASTAPSSRVGLRLHLTGQKPNAFADPTPGCTPTTTTGTTPAVDRAPLTRVNNLPGHYARASVPGHFTYLRAHVLEVVLITSLLERFCG